MKQVIYTVDKTLEEVCDITVDFWTNQINNAFIEEVLSYENDRVRVMKVNTGFKWGFFTSSYGENYHIVFERPHEDFKKTKITISIHLKFGYGAQWKVPSDNLKKWALLFDLEPDDFGRKPFIITWAILGPLFLLIVGGTIGFIIYFSSFF
ncbi:MAG: hypothetical protein GNW80_12090 [Asgard group archaeon]|nr:hypothetical protein [Asgard group archaeon]